MTTAAALRLDPAAPPAPSRRFHLDNIRSLVMLLVVGMHSNVTYSGMGRWYYVEGRPDSLAPLSSVVFGLYGSFMQAWFMGILFFLAGHFAAGSLARRGCRAFVRERLFRLGAPLLLYVFVLEPLLAWWMADGGKYRAMPFPKLWLGYVFQGYFASGTGPLWFVETLLAFCLAYAAVRALRERPMPRSEAPAPGNARLLLIVAITGAAAFAIRLVMPIGSALLNLQFSFFASYVALFVLGVHSGETGWLDRLPERRGLGWFWSAIGVGVPAWLVLRGAGGPMGGGLHWQALTYAFWEAFVAVAMSIGLVVFARRHLAGGGRIGRFLAETSFGVYFFHTPVLIGISLLLAPLAWPMLAKHALVVPLAYFGTLIVAAGARRVPLLNSVVR